MSSRKRRTDFIELAKQKVSWSQLIVQKDAKYGEYAGAYYNDAEEMAFIDFCLEFDLIPKELIELTGQYRKYLDYKRKAFFVTLGCGEVSKLGFILGDTRIKRDAQAEAHENPV